MNTLFIVYRRNSSLPGFGEDGYESLKFLSFARVREDGFESLTFLSSARVGEDDFTAVFLEILSIFMSQTLISIEDLLRVIQGWSRPLSMQDSTKLYKYTSKYQDRILGFELEISTPTSCWIIWPPKQTPFFFLFLPLS